MLHIVLPTDAMITSKLSPGDSQLNHHSFRKYSTVCTRH